MIVLLKDEWFTVTQLNEDTFAISEYGHWEEVHSFLLLGSKKAVLIDTGLGIKDISIVTKQLTNLPILVLTTHVHTDHIGSHGSFSEIAVHPQDADWLENGIKGPSLAQVRKDLCRDLTQPLPKEFDVEKFVPYQGKPTLLLKDGMVLSLGNRELEIIHTPGHSPGHISILDRKHRFLFTGDLLYCEAPIYAFYPSTSPQDLLNSILKLAKLENINRVFGSHHLLGMEPEILEKAKVAALMLRKKEDDQFGTGLHEFGELSFLF